jgi:hypothetical protein
MRIISGGEDRARSRRIISGDAAEREFSYIAKHGHRKIDPISGGADGLFYNDLREPFLVADLGAVTMTTTAKALYPAVAFPNLGANYFNRVGKMLKITLWLKMALGATPGNFSFNVHFGTGADANGTLICVAGTPVALTASVTKCGYAIFTIRCISIGTVAGASGTLQCTGIAWFDHLIIANTLQPIMVPTAGAAASAALALDSALIPSVQVLQSGTAGTIQVQQMEVVAMN